MCIFSMYTINICAQTSIPGGVVSGTWTKSGSPYKVEGSIQIPNGSTLTIEPGVVVDFQGQFKIDVKGRLLAIGTKTDSIFFTTDTTVNSGGVPDPMPKEDTTSWRGIVFDNVAITNDTSKIMYCNIQFVKGGLGKADQGAIIVNNFSKLFISNNTFMNCGGNGVIYCYNGASPKIWNNLIAYNTTVGIYCGYGCYSSIRYNMICNNNNGLMAGTGGGVYCDRSSPTLFNNIIANNKAGNGGGIACYYYSTPKLYNNIIVNNSAYRGGGMFFQNTNTDMNPSIYNTIIWGNKATSTGQQIALIDEENDPNFYYCNIQGGTAAFDINGMIYAGTYQNNINTNPLFVNPTDSVGVEKNALLANWRLQSTSPCIDSGDPSLTYPDYDIAGNARVNECRIDMGAYEYPKGIPFNATLSITTPITCKAGATGAIKATPVGGTTPYSYLWSNGKTTQTISSLNAGVYSVTVTSASAGCATIKSITLDAPIPVAVNAGGTKTIVCDGQLQLNAVPDWVALNSGVTDPLYSVYFTSADTGYAVGGFGGGTAIILKTNNGGKTWIKQETSPSASRLYSVYFVNSKTGYAAGEHGVVLKTTDGGITWVEFRISNVNLLKSIYFTDANTGFAVGQGIAEAAGAIYKTTDGGTNWTTVSSGNQQMLNSIHFISADTGFVVGNNGIILKTTNGGNSWTQQATGNNFNWNSVYFSNDGTGYIAGGNNVSNGVVLKTINKGDNWSALSSSFNKQINAIYTQNNDAVYGLGYGGLFIKSNNQGANWDTVIKTITSDLHAMHFPNQNTGYAVGKNGIILKSSGIFTYTWTPSTGLSNNKIQNPLLTTTKSTKYIVTAKSGDGCLVSDSLIVNVTPLTVNGSFASISCGENASLNTTTNFTGLTPLTYSWTPASGLSNPSVPNPTATVNSSSSSKTYTVNVSTPNGCKASDIVTVSNIPMNPIEICLVSVDTSNKNLIIWEKQTSATIDSFYVYKETNVTNNYARVGAVAYSDLSVFLDVKSNPKVQSNKYKIAILDNCGMESEQSDYHKTMHLTINKGVGSAWNLIWEKYEGFTVSTYNIYRGTSANDLQLIGSSSGANTQYTDLNPPTGYVYYQVEIVSPNVCTPTRTYNTSRSNIASNDPSIGISEVYESQIYFTIYPNPATNQIVLNVNGSADKAILTVYNLLGEQVFSTQINKQQEVDISSLSSGIYIVEVIANGYAGKQKLIIER